MIDLKIMARVPFSSPELLWYNSSGGLDTAYGSGSGIVSLGFTGWTAITGIVVQPNGKLDLAVTTSSGGMNVAQLTSAGAADTSFGSSGLETLSSLPAAKGIVLAANGDLVVAGLTTATFKVEELSPSTGSPDTSYNTSGTASILANSNGSTVTYIGMALMPDGDLLLSGRYVVGGTPIRYYLAMVAITPTGLGDSSFGTSGGVSGRYTQEWGMPYAPGDTPMAVSPTGEILIGYASSHSGALFLGVYEFNPDGSINSSFGTDGFARGNLSSGSTNIILAIETNGQIVIGDGSGSGTFNLVRFNADGTLDTTFGSSGIESGASESGGLAMMTAANGETVMVGTPSSGSGIILQEFHTLANAQRVYVEQDANYNVTSITDTSGNVVERYEYDPYGSVTVLNPNGTTRGDGSINSSFYAWVYTFQGGQLNGLTGQIEFEYRDDNLGLGRWDEEDPSYYINGASRYQYEISSPVGGVDPTGQILLILNLVTGVTTAYDAAEGPPPSSSNFWSDVFHPLNWAYTGDPDASQDEYDAGTSAAGEWEYYNSPVRGAYISAGAPVKTVGVVKVNVSGTGTWTIDNGFGAGGQVRLSTPVGNGGTFSAGGGVGYSQGQGWGGVSSIRGTGDGVNVGGLNGNTQLGLTFGPVQIGLLIDSGKLSNLF